MTTDQDQRGTTLRQTDNPEAKVAQHRASGRRGISRHASEIVAAGQLYGRPLADILTRSFEDVTENAGEVDYWWTRRVDQLADQVEDKERAINIDRTVLGELRGQVEQLEATVRTLFREFDRRARKDRPLPTWLEELRPDDIEEAPF